MEELADNFQNHPYLLELFRHLEERKEQDRPVSIEWRALKKKGVGIKTGGVNAYVPLNYMPWIYPIAKWWEYVLPRMDNRRWRGKVIAVDYSRPFVAVDARQSPAELSHLIKGQKYAGIVLRKTKYSLTLEMGMHFHWKCGSVIQEMSYLDLEDPASILAINPGEVLRPRYLGTTDENEWILSEHHRSLEERDLEWKEIFEKEVEITVKKDPNGLRTYLVKNRIPVSLLAQKNIYGPNRDKFKAHLKNLQNGDTLKGRMLNQKLGESKLKAYLPEFQANMTRYRNPPTDPLLDRFLTIGERIKDEKVLNDLKARGVE